MISLLASSSCQSWQATSATPGDVLARERPESVRLTLTTGEVVTVDEPVLRNDSVASEADPESVTALSDVRRLEVRRLHGLRSAAFAVVIVAVAASWTALVSGSEGSSRIPEPPTPKN